MNRGSRDLGRRPDDVDVASMRPRFMNRGSVQGVEQLAKLFQGFNEAPIHESGKLRKCSSWKRRLTGFNEAPIHESGKCKPDDCWPGCHRALQ